ncbi:[protein-PII] uridylyltransferase [Aquirhabdus parva]|uniref:Bifunctional uridylyltransferase/uridylyl-removing enzyme n=1 Tax=Aquirhabdus parva TaxID=2283318 RepID=A0A345P6Q0_9GAMM|nr:[protein-PII] uridylyltransferase [Aquirhabdus parva]AXI02959.1 [protein-PII] uridylyltransferase [Aquirhabdus parva]
MSALPSPLDYLPSKESPSSSTGSTGNNCRGLIQWRQLLEKQLDEKLEAGESIRSVVHARTHAIDDVLQHLWNNQHLSNQGIALIAVGGYGRGELLPKSDVDVMILSQNPLTEEQEGQVSLFVASLWDAGLEPGVSVRTLSECIQTAQDITVATSLVESRLIVGDKSLSLLPRRIVSDTWTDLDFYNAKMAEQSVRYGQHHNTEYNLEPDIKNAPGGLRDINQIGWIAKRYYRVVRLYDLVHLGFISEFEYNELESCEDFLWLIRHHLHRITNRNENRLLFDYQRAVAERLNYHSHESDHQNAIIERFMRDYYRAAMRVSSFNEMLLAYFYETAIEPKLKETSPLVVTAINDRFELINGKISARHHRVFSETPSSILEIFFLMASRNDAIGIRARTLRLLMLAVKGIDDAFRQNPMHRALFMAIIRGRYRLYETFQAMKRYGVLGKYLPAFGQIIGLMQYDLFHIYTVDMHTLILLRNLQRFGEDHSEENFPVVSQIFKRLDRKDIIYLAALFHDIAKGRGGDHSELGAIDATEFCLAHGLTQREANIVAWLTQNHLLMSLTAQKKDISDPDIIHEFAQKVGDMVHLDYLYTLTVADINATNPTLWNTWRASLLRQLYNQTRRVLRSGLDNPMDRQSWIEDTKKQSFDLLAGAFERHAVEKIWQEMGDDYFLRERPSEVAWHTREILLHGHETPLVLMREHRELNQDAVQIFIYTHDLTNLFAATVAVFDQMELNVQDARIITAKTGFSVDTYVVLDKYGTLLTDPVRNAEVTARLKAVLAQPEKAQNLSKRRMPRQLRHFNVPSEVTIKLDIVHQHNVVEIISLDRPGLLAQIGALFFQKNIDIQTARIATLGERAEDVFFITDSQGKPLDNAAASALAQELKHDLDAQSQA